MLPYALLSTTITYALLLSQLLINFENALVKNYAQMICEQLG